MKINYQIMNEQNKLENGKYLPDYDSLIKNATCEEEIEKLLDLKNRNFTFAFNMVYITKQKCGHWEVFQTPLNEYHTLEKNLKEAEEHAINFNCTKCICKF